MRRFGLIGYPLGHSFSKKYFAEKFLQENVQDAVYDNYPIPHISELPQVLQTPGLAGLNVTIPYKEQVIPYLDTLSDVVGDVGACNCIHISGDRLIGYNTDVVGFEQSFSPLLQSHHTRALILGTGGAAKAVAYVLKKLQIEYRIVSRTEGANNITYEAVTPSLLQEYSVLINTTPLGMYPAVEQAPALPYEAVTDRHYLYDLVYNPAVTKFLEYGEQKGALIKNGADMLMLQAEESWRIWNPSSNG